MNSAPQFLTLLFLCVLATVFACPPLCHCQNDVCVTCDPGFWGANCTNNCSLQCSLVWCNFTDGSCSGCVNGFWGPTCSSACAVGCSSVGCSQTTGQCSSCTDGLWGPYCNNTCPGNCSTCDLGNGTCLSCVTNLWGAYCNETCSPDCDPLSGCNFVDGVCVACADPRTWGPVCAAACPVHCANSSAGGACDQFTGLCSACTTGWFNATCDTACSAGCDPKDGCMQSSGVCFGCVDKLWGPTCSQACPAQCMGQLCDHVQGFCTACPASLWGLMCNQTCGACSNGACYQRTGLCPADCTAGFWGSSCTQQCGLHTTQCAQADGAAMACDAKWFGPTCKNPCDAHCVLCTATSSNCSLCEASYSGPGCTIIDKPGSGSSNTGLVAAVVVLAILCAVLLATAVYLGYRLRAVAASADSTVYPDAENAEADAQRLYQTPNRTFTGSYTQIRDKDPDRAGTRHVHLPSPVDN